MLVHHRLLIELEVEPNKLSLQTNVIFLAAVEDKLALPVIPNIILPFLNTDSF